MKAKVAVILAVIAIIAAVTAIAATARPKAERYETHCVEPGETLWGIAKEYNPEAGDVNAVIHEMKKKNGMRTSDIYAGDIIEVPIM